jgi:hypothetical protein
LQQWPPSALFQCRHISYNVDDMSGIRRSENWPKIRALLCASVGLCLLIAFCALSWYPCESAQKHVSSPLSISSYFQDYVSVSVAPRVRDNLRRASHAKDNTYSRTVSTHGLCMAAQTYLRLVANLHRNMAPLCSLAGISEIGLQRACQLLDIPPPSNTLSF